MLINPNTLKYLRKQNGYSQCGLEIATKGENQVSLSTIKRIEGAIGMHKANPRIAKKLAAALGVNPEDLSKDPENLKCIEEPNSTMFGQTLKIHISNSTASSMRMVEYLYGISVRDQVRMAPLIVALLAEGSLNERRVELEEINLAIETLTNNNNNHLAFTKRAYLLQDEAECEADSIRDRDIFGHKVSEDSFVEGYDPSTNNPFADYLRKFAADVDVKDADIVINKDEIGEGKIPEYSIGEKKFKEISGNDELAEFAVTRGYARIADIPKDLIPDEAREKRIQWLIDKIPVAARNNREQQIEDFAKQFPKLNLHDLDLDKNHA